MEKNKAQLEFIAKALATKVEDGLWGVSQISMKPITYVTTYITCYLKDEEEMRKRIYNLEIELMASDPDTQYDFRVIVKQPPKI